MKLRSFIKKISLLSSNNELRIFNVLLLLFLKMLIFVFFFFFLYILIEFPTSIKQTYVHLSCNKSVSFSRFSKKKEKNMTDEENLTKVTVSFDFVIRCYNVIHFDIYQNKNKEQETVIREIKKEICLFFDI